jgi:CRISPR-associated protein Csm3
MKLHKKIILKYKLTILTGIHIGDAKENAEIGGVDSPVVRRKDNNQPYIPGSSIKGKIRSLLELAHGANTSSKFNDYPGKSVIIPHLFGATQGTETNPSRIIIRDAFLTSDAISKFGGNEFTDLPYSEVKAENSINRVRGVADHPRFIERIPAGTEFDLEMIINIFDTKQEKDF